jgi:hypothetical protein
MTSSRPSGRDHHAVELALGEKVVITEFLLTGLLLPPLLIPLALGLERIEDDLDRSAPPSHRHRSPAHEREER